MGQQGGSAGWVNRAAVSTGCLSICVQALQVGTVKIWDLRAGGYQREYESRGAVTTVVLHPNQTVGAARWTSRGH
jgi:hypothetical protein